MDRITDEDSGQEVTRQVSGTGWGDANSLDLNRSLSPRRLVDNGDINLDDDMKISEIYRLRIVALEKALKEAKLKCEPEPRSNPVASSSRTRAEEMQTVKGMEGVPIPARPTEIGKGVAVDLPRVELVTFGGETAQYWKFIRQFENFVESKISDPGQRFLYLMHYCRGKAREAIEECIMLPNELSYDRAREILRDLYGQPHHVARTLIDTMLAEAKRTRNEADSLSRLVIRMQNCYIALSQMNYEADLNALCTLEAIVRCLPAVLQHKWAEEAETIGRLGREPRFNELTEFIRRRARVVNGRFGVLAANCDKEAKPNPRERQTEGRGPRITSNLAASNSHTAQGECPLCHQTHYLNQCERFLSLSVTDRWATAKRVGACFCCLNTSHRASNCRRRVRCGEKGCTRNHHILLHESKGHLTDSPLPAQCLLAATQDKPARLGTIMVGVVTSRGVVPALAFLDNGSDTTLVSEAFVRRHNIATVNTSLAISTVNGTCTSKAGKLTLQLRSLETNESLTPTEAYTVSQLPMRAITAIKTLTEEWPHLKSVPFNEIATTEVDILVGCDIPEAHWVLDQRLGGRKEPYATRTVFGWVMFGPLSSQPRGETSINLVHIEGKGIDDSLRRLYDAEFVDTTDERRGFSVEDREALEIVQRGSRFEDGRFIVPLPWRSGAREAPNNRVVAERRLAFLQRRLTTDGQLATRYQAAMQATIDSGYVERVTGTPTNTGSVWYLPHHPVFNPKKPEKTRVVFDCAAKYQGSSLNDRLLQGPDWTTPLIEVLCRFRLGRVAVSADIKEMFMQVRVSPQDRDALRFLWWNEGDISQSIEEYRFLVHPFGAVSSPFCANFALRATVERAVEQSGLYYRADICEHFYVDDLLCAFDEEADAITYVSEVGEMLRAGGFHLTKWLSNSRRVLESVPEGERVSSVRDFAGHNLPIERMLGVHWDAERDQFILHMILPERNITRRGLLSSVSSLYDPLGFVAPWLLPGKLLLQKLCKQQQGWDAPLNDEDQREWHQWLSSLTELGEVTIQRAIPQLKGGDNAEMHVFADASEEGYGAVAYGCWIIDGIRQTDILFAKARVAPVKKVTIPRLELTASVLAIKLMRTLKRCYCRVQWNVTLWTDSTIVLHYIRNRTTRFSTFVANRLEVIHSESQPEQWRHVRSELNPADFCSRGLTNLRKLQMWLHGPRFLTLPEDQWPRECLVEVSSDQLETKRAVVMATTTESNALLDKLARFGEWITLLRAISWWGRFKDYLLTMKGRRPDRVVNIGPIKPEELEASENLVLRWLQDQCFPAEMKALTTPSTDDRHVWPRNSSLRKLNPVLREGLLRVGGRLSESNLDANARHPIILPKNHHVTALIMQHIHSREGHAGVTHLWNTLRRKYWILQGKQMLKRVIRRCLFCRRQNSITNKQLMAPLPAIRVQAGWRPFTAVGLDFFGPLQVKLKGNVEKRYGCVMTCMQSRAIHLEATNSMSTDSFLMALQRFIGRRGVPKQIISDNGSNFVGAHNELRRWINRLDRRRLVNHLAPLGIRWRFNPPYSSHRGGVWERMIRSVRRTILAVGGSQIPNDEVLQTLLVEVERILNNRPIVPAGTEASDQLALTPNDLVLLHNNSGIETPRTISSAYQLGWKQAHHLANVFWKRWTSEYLPTLQLRQKWLHRSRELRPGDVVLIAEDHLQRDQWPLGIVRACQPGVDGIIRTVKVKTKQGEVVRDIRKICYLEGDGDDEPHENLSNGNSELNDCAEPSNDDEIGTNGDETDCMPIR